MNRLRSLFLAPAWVVIALGFWIPMGIVAAYSVLTRGMYGGVESPFTAESLARFADPLYLGILVKSFLLAGIATVLCALMGFPLALFIARSGPRRNLWLSLVMLPFWTSFLIRTYAWVFLLRDSGLFNTMLQAAGLIAQPLPLLYNDGAVVTGLVYGYLPFFVLPVYATLERQDPLLRDAAADLGASPWATLRRVTIPLAAPGIRAGALLVFVPSLGTYITSDLLGGSKTVLIGNLVQNQFTTGRDWPFGAAAGMVLMSVVAALLLLLLRRDRETLL